MAELDTYKCIEQYAKTPQDETTYLRFQILRKRAGTVKNWNAITCGGLEHAEAFSSLYIGVVGGEGKASKPKRTKTIDITGSDLATMSVEDQHAFYIQQCASVNIKIDPSALVHNHKDIKE